MKLTREGIKEREAWEKAGINLPGYDVEAVTEKAKKEPGWVHFGIGNIFRVFIGGIADGLLEGGVLDRGITWTKLTRRSEQTTNCSTTTELLTLSTSS